MEIDTRKLGEKVFITVLDDYDEGWDVFEGEIGGIIVTVDMNRTWIQYNVETENGPEIISAAYAYPEKVEAEKRCQLLNKVKSS